MKGKIFNNVEFKKGLLTESDANFLLKKGFTPERLLLFYIFPDNVLKKLLALTVIKRVN
jgi:hypothetical protein